MRRLAVQLLLLPYLAFQCLALPLTDNMDSIDLHTIEDDSGSTTRACFSGRTTDERDIIELHAGEGTTIDVVYDVNISAPQRLKRRSMPLLNEEFFRFRGMMYRMNQSMDKPSKLKWDAAFRQYSLTDPAQLDIRTYQNFEPGDYRVVFESARYVKNRKVANYWPCIKFTVGSIIRVLPRLPPPKVCQLIELRKAPSPASIRSGQKSFINIKGTAKDPRGYWQKFRSRQNYMKPENHQFIYNATMYTKTKGNRRIVKYQWTVGPWKNPLDFQGFVVQVPKRIPTGEYFFEFQTNHFLNGQRIMDKSLCYKFITTVPLKIIHSTSNTK